MALNTDTSVEAVNSWEKLTEYKKQNPNTLIIASHPLRTLNSISEKELYQYQDIIDLLDVEAKKTERSRVAMVRHIIRERYKEKEVKNESKVWIN